MAPMRARALRGREAPTTAPPPFCSPFVAAFVAFALAQCLKVVTFYVAEGRWDATRLVGSGGMVRGREEGGSARARGQHPFPPPRFPALVPHRRRGRAGRLYRSDARHGVRGVCDLRGAVPGRGRRHPAPAPNPESPDPNPTPQPDPPTRQVLASVVAYDASGVRLAAGRHATVLNSILVDLPADHPACEHRDRPLRDSLGHTPLQVAAGAALGAVAGYGVGCLYR